MSDVLGKRMPLPSTLLPVPLKGLDEDPVASHGDLEMKHKAWFAQVPASQASSLPCWRANQGLGKV